MAIAGMAKSCPLGRPARADGWNGFRQRVIAVDGCGCRRRRRKACLARKLADYYRWFTFIVTQLISIRWVDPIQARTTYGAGNGRGVIAITGRCHEGRAPAAAHLPAAALSSS